MTTPASDAKRGLSPEQRDVLSATLVYLGSAEAWFAEVDAHGVMIAPDRGVVVAMLPTASRLLRRWEELGLAEALGLRDDEEDEEEHGTDVSSPTGDLGQLGGQGVPGSGPPKGQGQDSIGRSEP